MPLGEGQARLRDDAPSEARGADGSRAGRHPPAHTATRHHRYGGRRRDRRARAGFETTHRDTHQHASRRRCGGRRGDRRAWLRCPWAAAGPGRHHTAPKAPPVWRAPEGPEGTGGLRDRHFRAFRLACGDLAGGRARRRPEHPWGHKQHKQEGRRPRAHQAARPNNTPRGARNASGATRNTAQGRGPTGPRP